MTSPSPRVPPTDHPDPIADWFKRHRVTLAWVIFLVLLLGRVPRLDEGTTGIVAFVYGTVFTGLLSWSFGTRQDWSEAGHHLKFGTLWTILLAAQIAMVAHSVARGNAFQGRWLVPMALVALLALSNWIPYRRIRSGRPWPPQPEGAAAQRSE